MRKSLKSLIASLLLVGSSAVANTDNLSINIGATSTTIASASSKIGGSLGLEWSFLGTADARDNKSFDTFFELAFNSADDGYVTKVALGARYEVAPKIWLGGSLGMSGLSLSENDYTGFMYALHGKYELTKNHGIILEYRNASMSDDSGFADIDVSSISTLYSYSF